MSFYTVEWSPGIVFLGVVLPILIVPGFALIALMVVVAAALAVVVAALLGIPYLLVRTLRRSLDEARRPVTRPAPIATAIARPATAVHR
jgi:hypothetical protein